MRHTEQPGGALLMVVVENIDMLWYNFICSCFSTISAALNVEYQVAKEVDRTCDRHSQLSSLSSEITS